MAATEGGNKGRSRRLRRLKVSARAGPGAACGLPEGCRNQPHICSTSMPGAGLGLPQHAACCGLAVGSLHAATGSVYASIL